MTTKKINIAPASAGGFEWRKIHAQLTGTEPEMSAEDRRHEYEEEARIENENFDGVRGR